MLPTPVSFRSSSRYTSTRHSRPLRAVLLSRARITNLGLALLAALAAVSVLLNLRLWFSSPPTSSYYASAPKTPPKLGSNNTLGYHVDEADARLQHLVLVPAHGIWTGTRAGDATDPDAWLMESFGRDDAHARAAAYAEHVRRGVAIAAQDPTALLVFSGGQTKPTSPLTEAASYHQLALALFPSSSLSSSPSSPLSSSPSPNTPSLPPPHTRTTTDPYALDSLQNLLFALARFAEHTGGHYPSRITVVGLALKQPRFERLHRAALRWPGVRFVYVGVDAEGQGEGAKDGEMTHGYTPFTHDTYGCHGSLASKRRARNPHHRVPPYALSAPALAPLLAWCPEDDPTAVFPGVLPWDGLA
ncbi:hypothetical protein BDW22DRAFT_1327305 [Trametopsis cervina]|nr:hypothetical protein BDW22DRAFT_1327305 [Trametopsis cervina]